MRQIRILGEHTICNLKASSILQLVTYTESIEITFLLHYFERFYRVYMLLTIGCSIGSNQFQTNSVVQAFLIYYISNGIYLHNLYMYH